MSERENLWNKIQYILKEKTYSSNTELAEDVRFLNEVKKHFSIYNDDIKIHITAHFCIPDSLQSNFKTEEKSSIQLLKNLQFDEFAYFLSHCSRSVEIMQWLMDYQPDFYSAKNWEGVLYCCSAKQEKLDKILLAIAKNESVLEDIGQFNALYFPILRKEKDLGETALIKVFAKKLDRFYWTIADTLYCSDNVVAGSKLVNWEENKFSDGNRIFKTNFSERLDLVEEVIYHYQDYGLIDGDTINEVFRLAKKFNKDLSREEFKLKLSQNEILKSTLELISSSEYSSINIAEYNKRMQCFRNLFNKMRFQYNVSSEAFNMMTVEMTEKFDYKVWKEFASKKLFNGEVGNQSLIEFIYVLGLFEKDKTWTKRMTFAKELCGRYGKFDLSKMFEWKKFDFEKYKITGQTINVYCKRSQVTIPNEFRPFLVNGYMCEEWIKSLKHGRGAMYRRFNTFLSPYTKDKKTNTYYLKENVYIPQNLREHIPQMMSDEEYKKIIYSEYDDICQDVDFTEEQYQDILKFINPIKKEEFDEYMIEGDFLESDLPIKFDCLVSQTSFHRMFDGCKLEYNEEFYEFFSKNINIFLNIPQYQRNLKVMQRNFQNAKKFYALNGNSQINFWDFKNYLDSISFDCEYGNEDFALQAKRAGVNDQKIFSEYEAIYAQMKKRKLSVMPRLDNAYNIELDGKKYLFQAKILRLDDPLTLLVGETSFTDCCQSMYGAGESCLKHSALSKEGGVLVLYVIDPNGDKQMLSQSWIWQNEGVLCLDNIEGTNLMKTRPEYKALVIEALKLISKDILELSRRGVKNYVEEKKKKIIENPKLKSEEAVRLAQLDEVLKRQTLKVVTAGLGYDDAGVERVFKRSALSVQPKGYQGYSDSKRQVVLCGDDSAIKTSQFEQVPIFRDERQLFHKIGQSISTRYRKKIEEISNENTKKAGKFELKFLDEFAEENDCSVNDVHLIGGEDWFCVYIDKREEISIKQISSSQPRLPDEAKVQQDEILKGFYYILKQSIIIKDGCVFTKEIKVKMAESLYRVYQLFTKKKIIEEISSNGAFKTFKAGDKIIKKLKENTLETLDLEQSI